MGQKKNKQRKIEEHLKNYQQYKIGINNLKLQLDSMMPKMTTSPEPMEGSTGTFSKNSPTEKYAIYRVESKRAIELQEKLTQYDVIVNCIDSALEGLDEEEQKLVNYFYFCNYTVQKIAMMMGYGESTIFYKKSKLLDKLSCSLVGIPDL